MLGFTRAGLGLGGLNTQMAIPARDSAAAQDPPHSRRKSDPMSPGWADVRLSLISDSHVVALAAAAVAARPDDDDARLLLGYALESFESTVTIARRWVLDEAVLEAEGQRRFDEGVEWCKAQRCRLEVIPGGAVPGPH